MSAISQDRLEGFSFLPFVQNSLFYFIFCAVPHLCNCYIFISCQYRPETNHEVNYADILMSFDIHSSKQYHMEDLSLHLGHVNKRNWNNHMQRQLFSINEFIQSDFAWCKRTLTGPFLKQNKIKRGSRTYHHQVAPLSIS